MGYFDDNKTDKPVRREDKKKAKGVASHGLAKPGNKKVVTKGLDREKKKGKEQKKTFREVLVEIKDKLMRVGKGTR